MFRGAVTFGLLVAGLVTLACSSGDGGGGPGANTDDERFTRTASVGEIEVEVKWLGSDDDIGEEFAGYPFDEFVLLEVSLDTHSGDLGSIDMAGAARLLAGGNSREPEEWIASSDDGHHRSGVLIFAREALTGPVALSVDLGAESAEFGWDEAPG